MLSTEKQLPTGLGSVLKFLALVQGLFAVGSLTLVDVTSFQTASATPGYSMVTTHGHDICHCSCGRCWRLEFPQLCTWVVGLEVSQEYTQPGTLGVCKREGEVFAGKPAYLAASVLPNCECQLSTILRGF